MITNRQHDIANHGKAQKSIRKLASENQIEPITEVI